MGLKGEFVECKIGLLVSEKPDRSDHDGKS